MKSSQLLHADITGKIWQAFRQLRREFARRPGFSECAKRNALAHALNGLGLSISTEVPVIHRRAGKKIGIGYLDLVVDCRVVVEVKDTLAGIRPEHVDQLQRYLEASGLAVGVVLNFGVPTANLDLKEDRRKVYRYHSIPENYVERKKP